MQSKPSTGPWASCQIRKIAGCACAGNAGNVFPRGRLQRKLLVSDPDMHHGTCVTHVPWCMSGSLNRGGGENVPGIPGACATHNITYPPRGPWGANLIMDNSETGGIGLAGERFIRYQQSKYEFPDLTIRKVMWWCVNNVRQCIKLWLSYLHRLLMNTICSLPKQKENRQD